MALAHFQVLRASMKQDVAYLERHDPTSASVAKKSLATMETKIAALHKDAQAAPVERPVLIGRLLKQKTPTNPERAFRLRVTEKGGSTIERTFYGATEQGVIAEAKKYASGISIAKDSVVEPLSDAMTRKDYEQQLNIAVGNLKKMERAKAPPAQIAAQRATIASLQKKKLATKDSVVEALSDDVQGDYNKKGSLLYRYQGQLKQATHFHSVVSKQLAGAKGDPKKSAELQKALGKWQRDIDEARAEIAKLEPVVAKLKEKLVKAAPEGRMALKAAGR